MNARAQQAWPVLADAVIPVSDGALRVARDIALVIGGCLLVALLAQVKIPLGFTPVPITGQTFAVLLVGASLGSWRGGSALLLYLVAGAWLPFYAGDFAQAMNSEFAWGWEPRFVWDLPTGGYIVGFIFAASAVGWLAERGWDRKVLVLVALLVGNVLLYLPGLYWLSRFPVEQWPCGSTMVCGLYPFILGDLIKLYAASLLLPGAWELVNLVKGRDQ